VDRRIGRALFVLALAATVLLPIGHALGASPVLPDLRMRTVSKVAIDESSIPGHKLLRYTTRIVNAGVGPFEVTASRPSTNQALMPVTQNIYQSDGSILATPTDTTLIWGGDGHNHWHVNNLEGADLRPEGGGGVLATAKQGFHAADGGAWNLQLPNAPQQKVYKACYKRSCQIGALNVGEGISVGWMDTYGYLLVNQWIDITDLADGRYVLMLYADPNHSFTEANPNNNTASATLSISGSTVRVLSRTGGV
jgi:Lysyl oxidase